MTVPELGGKLFVREMTAPEALEFGASCRGFGDMQSGKAQNSMMDRLLELTICTAAGERRLSDGEMADIRWPLWIKHRIYDAASDLNRLSQESAEKNSEATRDESSPSD